MSPAMEYSNTHFQYQGYISCYLISLHRNIENMLYFFLTPLCCFWDLLQILNTLCCRTPPSVLAFSLKFHNSLCARWASSKLSAIMRFVGGDCVHLFVVPFGLLDLHLVFAGNDFLLTLLVSSAEWKNAPKLCTGCLKRFKHIIFYCRDWQTAKNKRICIKLLLEIDFSGALVLEFIAYSTQICYGNRHM